MFVAVCVLCCVAQQLSPKNSKLSSFRRSDLRFPLEYAPKTTEKGFDHQKHNEMSVSLSGLIQS